MTARPGQSRAVASGVAGAAGLIAVMTILARVAGFGRVVVFADAVRAGGVGEIYQAINTVPNVLFEVAAGGVLAAVAVPLVGRHLGRGDTGAAHRLANALLTWVVVLLVPVAVLLGLCADPIAGLLLPARDPSSHAVGAAMLRIFAVQVPLYGIGIVLAGLLHAHRRFLTAALAPLLSSIVVLASYLWYGQLTHGATGPSAVSSTALAVLSWGTTLGVVVLSLPLLVPAWRTGWRWRPTLHLAPEDRARVTSLAGAGLVGLLAQQIAVLVTVWLAARAAEPGALPVQAYLQAVYLLPYAVLAVPIATSVFPVLAQEVGAANVPTSRDSAHLVARALRGILLLTGLAGGMMLAAAPAIGGFFSALDARRGADGASQAALAALPGALLAYVPGMVGFSATALLTRAMYVRGRPMQAAAAVATGWCLAAVLPLLMVGPGASAAQTLRALGLGSSIGMLVSASALWLLVRSQWGRESVAGTGRSASAVIVAMALALMVGDAITHGRRLDSLGSALGWGVVSASAAMVVGFAAVALMDRELIRSTLRAGRARRAEQGSAQ